MVIRNWIRIRKTHFLMFLMFFCIFVGALRGKSLIDSTLPVLCMVSHYTTFPSSLATNAPHSLVSKDCFLEAFGCFPTQPWHYSNHVLFLRQTEFPTNEKALNFFAKTLPLFLAEALWTVPSFFPLEKNTLFFALKKHPLKEKKDIVSLYKTQKRRKSSPKSNKVTL